MRREDQRYAERPRPLFDSASLPNARASSLPNDLDPELATPAEFAPTGDLWVHETKFDGYRLLARIDGTRVRLLGRDRQEWRLPVLEQALASLTAGTALLDGQLVALQSDGTSSLRQLQETVARGRTAQLVYESFDLLHLDGYDLTEVDLASRKRALKNLLTSGRVIPNRGAIRYVHHFEGHGAELFDEICRLGLAGIVCKLRTSRYRSGPSADWLEVQSGQRGAALGRNSYTRLGRTPSFELDS